MRVADAEPGVEAGYWTITSEPRKPNDRWIVDVVCVCGRESICRVDTLPPVGPSSRPSTRCSWCSRATNVTDMRTAHPLYDTWRSMIVRCQEDPSGAAPNWVYYGGRGIKVCDEWACPEDGFWRFAAHVGERPEGHTLDRIDVNGDYEPGNVRWATHSEQIANRRTAAEGPF